MREIHEFWANIIQIALAAWLLSVRIGFACIGPIIVCVVSLAATVLCSKPSQKYMLAWVEKVQERIGAYFSNSYIIDSPATNTPFHQASLPLCLAT